MRILIGLVMISFLFSCKKEESKEELPIASGSYMLIGNEGNYQLGNASLTLCNLNNGESHQKIFEQQNQESLGDVVQSLALYQNRIYAIVNNSSKIEVLDLDLNRIQTLHGFNAPRYIAFYNDFALVSELYSKELHLVNLQNGAIQQSFSVSNWIEKMSIKDSLLYCSAMDNNELQILNLNQMTWAPSIYLKNGFDQVVLHGNFGYALCNIDASTSGTLYKIDLISGLKSDSLSIPYLSSTQLCKGNDQLYFIGDQNVYQVDFDLNSQQLFLAGNGRNFYGLDFDDQRGLLMVSDVKDYIQQGNVSSFYENGNNVFNFEAGIIPSSFLIFDK